MEVEFTEYFYNKSPINKHLAMYFCDFREVLIKKLGFKRSKNILFHYGWQLGVKCKLPHYSL